MKQKLGSSSYESKTEHFIIPKAITQQQFMSIFEDVVNTYVLCKGKNYDQHGHIISFCHSLETSMTADGKIKCSVCHTPPTLPMPPSPLEKQFLQKRETREVPSFEVISKPFSTESKIIQHQLFKHDDDLKSPVSKSKSELTEDKISAITINDDDEEIDIDAI
jgi:hypothetical protein